MVKLIRANQKKFLAGFSVLLMVTFLLNRGGSGNSGVTEHEAGTIGGKTIYSSEMAESRAEVSALRSNITFSDDDRDGSARLLREIIMMLAQKPELFFLLRHEARDIGVQVSNDEVLSLMVNHARGVQPDTDIYDLVHAGVTDLLKIIARFEQVSSAVKTSKPMVNLALVQEHETIQANLVQFNAQDYVAKVAPPTTQQVAEQFAKFSDSPPHHPVPMTNPFGFGYKLPLRAKLQYVRLTTDAVASAVTATKSAYDWEVVANKYYLLNSAEFIAKPTTTAPVATPPVAPPLTLVHDQVLQKIRQPLVSALTDQVQGYVSSTLNSDYQNYTKSIGSKEPDSSLGVPYSSFTYLSKLIAKVQAKFNVSITAGESPDYLDANQAGAIPGVGSTAVVNFVIKESTNYLAQIDAKSSTAAAMLMRPSMPLQESTTSNSMAFVRVTAALPSQTPSSLDQVRGSVAADLRIASAYKIAQNDATAQLASAKAGILLATAQATGHPVISLDAGSALALNSNDVKGVYPPLADSAPSFMTQTFSMLNTYHPIQNAHPAVTIELPQQVRLFVAQLTAVTAGWNSESYFRDAFEAGMMARSQEQGKLFSTWFDYASVVKRLNFAQMKSNKN